MSEKDIWDKAEIVSKFLVPLVVAISVLIWNGQRTRADTSATMIKIALGVLQSDIDPKKPDAALREWAIEVMRNPDSPPRLSEQAALELSSYPFDWMFAPSWRFIPGLPDEKFSELLERYERDKSQIERNK